MTLELISRLLADPDPGFACLPTRGTAKEPLIFPLEHLANPPASAELLGRIPSVPGATAAKEFYSAHNGALLYTDRQTGTKGIEIFPIEQWEQRTADMVESWIEGDYAEEEMPYGHDDFISFAYARGASSYIHWVIRGPHAGSIYWWPWTMPPDKDQASMADNFHLFIKLIYDNPVYFFNELLLCYMRFSDGQTVADWIPSRYLPDQTNPAVWR